MNIIDRGKLTLLLESENLKLLSEKLDNNFENAVNELFNIIFKRRRVERDNRTSKLVLQAKYTIHSYY